MKLYGVILHFSELQLYISQSYFLIMSSFTFEGKKTGKKCLSLLQFDYKKFSQLHHCHSSVKLQNKTSLSLCSCYKVVL